MSSDASGGGVVLRGYAVAGELYGVLRGKLSHGELTMRSGAFVGDVAPTSIVYRLTFSDGGERFSFEQWVLFESLVSCGDVESFAEHLVSSWGFRLERPRRVSSSPDGSSWLDFVLRKMGRRSDGRD